MRPSRSRPSGNFELIPPGAERRLAELFERDAKTFGRRDWESGTISLSEFVNFARDALNRLLARDTTDDWAARVCWAMLGYMHVEALVRAGRLSRDLADMPAPDPILVPAAVVLGVLPEGTDSCLPPAPPPHLLPNSKNGEE